MKIFNIELSKIDKTAFVHSSYANEKNIASNERLEFLGDAVLSLVVGEYLYSQTEMKEGNLSKARAGIVNGKNTANIAKKLNIEQFILLGNSLNNNPVPDKILEDCLEAVIGAIYIDYGLDVVRECIINLFELDNYKNVLKNNLDYKSILSEYCQKHKMNIEYKNEENDNYFAIYINGKINESIYSKNKKEAEKKLSELVYKKLIIIKK